MPALDLRAGAVVHARGGRRDRYLPLRSALCATADPLDVVAGLRRMVDFPAIYVADLDAIAGTGDHDTTLVTLRRAFDGLELWVDRGVRTLGECRRWCARGLGTAVIGSEARPEPELIAALAEVGAILSLDHRNGRLDGPSEILAQPGRWPDRIIAMDLDRVGAGRGPGLERLSPIIARATGRAVFAGGGVRDAPDLRALAGRGAAGALVASALHEGSIGREDLLAAGRAARIDPRRAS